MGSPLSVGDCLQLTKIFYQVYEACVDGRKGAPAAYAELKNEVLAMETALEQLEKAISIGVFRQRVSEGGVQSTEERLSEMIENCRTTLCEVVKTLGDYSEHLEDANDDEAVVGAEGGGVLEKESRSEKWRVKLPSLSWPRPGSTPSTLQTTIPKTTSRTTTALVSQGQWEKKKRSNGGASAFVKTTFKKIIFATVKVDDLIKLIDQLRVHTGCLQFFLQILNSQSNQRIETDIVLIRQFAETFMNFVNSSGYSRSATSQQTRFPHASTTQEEWLLENSSKDDEAGRVLAQILSRAGDHAREASAIAPDNNELVRPFTISNARITPPPDMTSFQSVTEAMKSNREKHIKPKFELYLEKPDTESPSLLICPGATLSDTWLTYLSMDHWDSTNIEVLTCECGDTGDLKHQKELKELRVVFNTFCTRRITTHGDQEIEWTIEGLKSGNMSHTARISGSLLCRETRWIDENFILPVVMQYGRYLHACKIGNLRANPGEDELEYAGFMGYCYSPDKKPSHKLSESLSFAPLLSAVTTCITHPLKDDIKTSIEIADIVHCYLVLYQTVPFDLSSNETPPYSELASSTSLNGTAELTILCDEQTKACHDLEMVLARFSEDTEFRTSSTSSLSLEFTSEQGQINFISGDAEFSEDIILSFINRKAMVIFLNVLKGFQWRLFLDKLKFGKMHEQLIEEFYPSAIAFKSLSLSNPRLHIFAVPQSDLSGAGFQVRLFAESIDGESCFSIPIDPRNTTWPWETTCHIIENVNNMSSGAKVVNGAFSQIHFSNIDDKTKLSRLIDDYVKQFTSVDQDAASDTGVSIDELTSQIKGL